MRRILTVCGLVALGVGAVVACGDARPDAATPGSSSAGGVCATPQEGCSCTIGSTAACAVKIKGDQNFVWCAEGTRTCTTGAWGSCETSGAMSVKSVPALSSGTHFQALGTSIACGSFDGGVALDPCDPYCQVTSDTPVGFDAGPTFIFRDGGILARGCADGVLAASEECDDGNGADGDGCTKTCTLEPGFQCPTPGAPCIPATCGNGGPPEGAEECDDGNLLPYDGCSPTCQIEVACPVGMACTAVCGDGVKFPGEACDDGNRRNGDGCSSTCAIEMGATCTTVTAALPASIDVPVIFRDFDPSGMGPGCSDFERGYIAGCSVSLGVVTGMVQSSLDLVDRKPRLTAPVADVITSAATFNEWYNSGPKAKTIFKTVTLTKQPDDSYLFDDPSFFPLDGQGWLNWQLTGRNYHFTSELRYPFTFKGTGTLNFRGDDDVWVFINGQLAVDIGGVHGPTTGSVTLNPTSFGMTVGNTYEIAIFQAERQTTGSSYQLSLSGFEQTKSVCGVPQNLTVVRDFEGVCQPGHHVTWQLFRWRASVPPGTSQIDFRAATADTLAGLPATPAPAPATVDVGSATHANSSSAGPVVWRNEMQGATPVPVSKSLKDEADQVSKSWLRIFMTFKPQGAESPRLDEWQQLYDCIPDE